MMSECPYDGVCPVCGDCPYCDYADEDTHNEQCSGRTIVKFGGNDDEVVDLREQLSKVTARLRDAQDLLEDCGYCRECLWDKEGISDIVEQGFDMTPTGEPVWPDDCTALCESCMKDFKELVE